MELNTGPELDKMVAEALGWEAYHPYGHLGQSDKLGWLPPGRLNVTYNTILRDHLDKFVDMLPPFSTDPGEAIKALEEFCRQWHERYGDKLHWKITDYGDVSIWGLAKARNHETADCFGGSSDDTAHAICLAIVEAAGVKT